MGMARCHMAMYEPAKAIDCYLEYLNVTQNDAEKCNVFHYIGTTYETLNDLTEALKYFQASHEAARKIEDENMVALASTKIGQCYLNMRNFQKAFECFKNALEIATSLNNIQDQVSALISLGVVSGKSNEFTKAIEFNQEALQLNNKHLNNKDIEASILGNLGVIFRRKGDFPQSLDYHVRQFAICLDIKFKEGQKKACAGLGCTYKSLGKYHEAIKWLLKAKDISSEIGDKAGVSNAQGNLGKVYERLGQYSSAIACYTNTLRVSRKLKDFYSEGRALFNLAVVCIQIGELDKAEKYAEDCLNVAQKVDDKQIIANTFGVLGNCKTISGIV